MFSFLTEGLGLSTPAGSDDDADGEQHVLAWRELNYAVRTRGRGTKPIVQDMSGRARPGRLLGILGPSGSGKVGEKRTGDKTMRGVESVP